VRQEPVGPYFVDFLCREQCLIVEIDGGQHALGDVDQKRDALMKALGYRIIRFWNNEVLVNIDGVLLALGSELQKAPHPNPLPASGERESTNG
jgi:very-short-patch-repair endonuclease